MSAIPTLAYRIYGDSGPPVVFLHGFANASSLWLPWALPLRKVYRCFLIDLPGHGASRGIAYRGEDPVAAAAAGVTAILEREALSDVRLVGYSLGAYIGWHLLLRGNSERVARFLLIDHPPWSQHDERHRFGLDPKVLARIDDVRRRVEALPSAQNTDWKALPREIREAHLAVMRQIAESSFGAPAARTLVRAAFRAGVVRRLAGDLAAWPWAYQFLRHYFLGTHDFRDELARVKIPVTAIAGERPGLFQGDVLSFYQATLPDCRVVRLPGADHGLMFRHPLAFHRALSDFLK